LLLIGYGNQGRGDDGLGPAFAARIEARRLAGLSVDADYQLTVEHALAVAEADGVVFVDASLDAGEPFFFAPVKPAETASIASHSLSPAAVLSLATTLYGRAPEAFVLGISGSVFGDVREGLSEEARHNLDRAEAFFCQWYCEFCSEQDGGSGSG